MQMELRGEAFPVENVTCWYNGDSLVCRARDCELSSVHPELLSMSAV